MEAALGKANWLLGQVLSKLSDDSVKAYVSSTELRLNLENIETEMQYTRGLLDAAQGRDVAGNPGLQRLLEMLHSKRTYETSGNVILVTTRFPKIVDIIVTKETNLVDLRGLDPDEFWKFFQICAFGRIQDDEHGDQELIGIARQISDKLKCSPLAAKTVGRLLIKKPL